MDYSKVNQAAIDGIEFSYNGEALVIRALDPRFTLAIQNSGFFRLRGELRGAELWLWPDAEAEPSTSEQLAARGWTSFY